VKERDKRRAIQSACAPDGVKGRTCSTADQSQHRGIDRWAEALLRRVTLHVLVELKMMRGF